jgi:hypothetical protein
MYNRMCPLGNEYDQLVISKIYRYFLENKREFKIEDQVLYFTYDPEQDYNDENMLASHDLLGQVQVYA